MSYCWRGPKCCVARRDHCEQKRDTHAHGATAAFSTRRTPSASGRETQGYEKSSVAMSNLAVKSDERVLANE